ncbi:cofilin [Fusarium oxysporum NRRL 32931]|uniref:Cofilin n=1 Tax=Fusarium oxysporum NRRL 32931 TaxID=660029 RepID=W9IZ18_FUSOX|nr:cofilin [Fusarium oxysporum NRRL 32931]
MSIPSGVQIQDECISAVNELRSRRDADKPRYVIYKISDNGQSVVVDETSSDKNYEAFLKKLASATDDKGKPAPRYAAYDVEYDLGEEGKR